MQHSEALQRGQAAVGGSNSIAYFESKTRRFECGTRGVQASGAFFCDHRVLGAGSGRDFGVDPEDARIHRKRAGFDSVIASDPQGVSNAPSISPSARRLMSGSFGGAATRSLL